MKRLFALLLTAAVIFLSVGCKDYVNREYTSEQAEERFDLLFDKIETVLKKYDIPFDESDVVLHTDKQAVMRSYEYIFEDGADFSIWMTYTFHEDKTGTETFYCGLTKDTGDGHINADDFGFLFEIGHDLSNMWSAGKSMREAEKLIELVKQQMSEEPETTVFRKDISLSEKYDLWNISYSVQRDGDDGNTATLSYEGLINI